MDGRHSTSGDGSATPRPLVIADRFVVRERVPGRTNAWRVEHRAASTRAAIDPCVLIDVGPLDSRAIVLRALVVRRLELAPPHATRYLDCVAADGRLYVVRTDVEGITLASRLRVAGPLPPEEALHVAVRVLEAAAFMHDRGLSVGGFDPDDIVLRPRPGRRDRIVLTRWRGPSSPDPTALPSQCDAQAIPDDIRSIGELLLVALCGPGTIPLPNEGQGYSDVLEALGDRIPLPIARVIHRCLRRDPQERPPNATAVLRALARRVATASYRAVPERPTEPDRAVPTAVLHDRSATPVDPPTGAFASTPRRRLLPTSLAAGLVLVVLGLLFGWAQLGASTPDPMRSGLAHPIAFDLRTPLATVALPSRPELEAPLLIVIDEAAPRRSSARRKRARPQPEPVAAPPPDSPEPEDTRFLGRLQPSQAEPAVIGRTRSKPNRDVLLPMDAPSKRDGQTLLPVDD